MRVKIKGRGKAGEPIDVEGDLAEDLKPGDSFLLSPGEENRVIIIEKTTTIGEQAVVTVGPYTKSST